MKKVEEDDKITTRNIQKRGNTQMNHDSTQDDQSIEGFVNPSEEIVAYAQKHDIHLNLRSKVVQRVLLLRMHMKKKAGNESGQERLASHAGESVRGSDGARDGQADGERASQIAANARLGGQSLEQSQDTAFPQAQRNWLHHSPPQR